MRIKHPDTFTCDICGRAILDDRAAWHVPVLIDKGITKNRKPVIEDRRIDVCDRCMEKVVNVKLSLTHVGGFKFEVIGDCERDAS